MFSVKTVAGAVQEIYGALLVWTPTACDVSAPRIGIKPLITSPYISGGSHVFSRRHHRVPRPANHCAR